MTDPGSRVASGEGGRGRPRPGQRGAVLALVIVFLPCLAAGVALVVDAGTLFVARSDLQAAADMGALAGVQDLDYDLLAGGDVVIKEADALRDAGAWVTANLTGRVFIDPASLRVVVAVRNTGAGVWGSVVTCPVTGRVLEYPTVCVSVTADVRLPFFSWFGPVTVSVHADASVVGRP